MVREFIERYGAVAGTLLGAAVAATIVVGFRTFPRNTFLIGAVAAFVDRGLYLYRLSERPPFETAEIRWLGWGIGALYALGLSGYVILTVGVFQSVFGSGDPGTLQEAMLAIVATPLPDTPGLSELAFSLFLVSAVYFGALAQIVRWYWAKFARYTA